MDGVSLAPRFLAIFDEARVLTRPVQDDRSDFEHLHRVFQLTPNYVNGGRLMGLVLDTTSQISNFSPSQQRDPSFRVHHSGRKLMDPFFEVCNMDVFSGDHSPKTMEQSSLPEHFLTFGRPYWFLVHQHPEGSAEMVIKMAMARVIGGLAVESWLERGQAIKPLECLSVLGCRLSLNVCQSVRVISTAILDEGIYCEGMRPMKDVDMFTLPLVEVEVNFRNFRDI